MNMAQEESFGIVPLCKVSGQWEVLLIQHAHSKYWGFPKGHAEPGEGPYQSAIRELKEETNLEVVRLLAPEPLTEQYRFMHDKRPIFKRVFYYVAEVAGTVILQAQEVQASVWVPFPLALEKVTHLEGRVILTEVAKILATL
jgi:8-oxo-dGTP pyrophosphatase MutT (NUDIX family)